jgi:cytochrome d ubiquinol oxidase subunit II
MATIWFLLVALMIATYVILDGFDLGVGVLHLFVARDDRERRTVLQSIGPVWDGNEVWLLAGAGALYMAFPLLYASAFSGFYLPLIMVVWLLILRASSIEFRSHIDSPVWRPFWDVVFTLSSLLLAVFLGAALGNVVRGVPLGEDGYFFAPLWTTFGVGGPEMGILDWYTVTVGLTATVALTFHGALWIILKTEDRIRERALWAASMLWVPLLVLAVLVTLFTFRIQPHIPARMGANPILYIFPALAVAALLASRWFTSKGGELGAFLSSSGFLAAILLTAVLGLYPNVLPASNDPALSLTIHNAAGPPYGLWVAFFWWVPGMALVVVYTTYVYRKMRGKVQLDPDAY